MGIADLKKQARALEQSGDAAAALTIYDEILSELERLALEPDGALYVKVGDLSLKTGQRSRAITLFERAAEEYAREGAHKAVTALCLKIHRTNPRRKDAHIRYARQLLGHGHVDATRQVLLDYAVRTGLEKTRQTLETLSERPTSEQLAKLDKFFEMADRAVRHSGERQAIPVPSPNGRPSEPTQGPAAVVEESVTAEPAAAAILQSADEQRAWPTGGQAEREPVALEPVDPKPSALAPVESFALEPQQPADPVVAAILAGPPEESQTVERVPEPVPSVVDGGQPAEPEQRTSSRAKALSTLKSSRLWPWPAAAAAVLVLGITLMGFGAIPFGGDLDADEPARPAALSVATASVLGTPTVDPVTPGDSTLATEVGAAGAINDSLAPIDSAVTEEPLGELTALDRNALTAASQAAVTVELEGVEDVLENDIVDVGKITVPTTLAARPEVTSNAIPSTGQPIANRMVVAIEGLPIVGMASSTDEYTLVQRLESGESVTLTVVPFTNAPAGETGRLSVRSAPGDSATGSRRYQDSWVTAQGAVTPAVLEDLLGRLRERNWR